MILTLLLWILIVLGVLAILLLLGILVDMARDLFW